MEMSIFQDSLLSTLTPLSPWTSWIPSVKTRRRLWSAQTSLKRLSHLTSQSLTVFSPAVFVIWSSVSNWCSSSIWRTTSNLLQKQPRMILKLDIKSFSALQNSSVSFVENCLLPHQTWAIIWKFMRKTVSTPAYIVIECSATNVCLITIWDQFMKQVEVKSFTATFVIIVSPVSSPSVPIRKSVRPKVSAKLQPRREEKLETTSFPQNWSHWMQKKFLNLLNI